MKKEAQKTNTVIQANIVEVSITNLRKDIFTYFEKVHQEKKTILVKKAGIEIGYLVPTE